MECKLIGLHMKLMSLHSTLAPWGIDMKKIGFVDKETGEYCESYVAVIQPKRRNGFSTRDIGWFSMSQGDPLGYITENRKFLGEEGLAVFLMLVKLMDTENYIQVNQSEVGKKLGMHRQSVQKAIKKLMSLSVFLEGPKVGRCRTYRLNPHVGWKGSAANHKEALKQYDHLKLVHDKDPEP